MPFKQLTRYANSHRLLLKVGGDYLIEYENKPRKVYYFGSSWNANNAIGIKKHWYHSVLFYSPTGKTKSTYETFIKDSDFILIS